MPKNLEEKLYDTHTQNQRQKSKLISPIALNFEYNISQLKEVYV